MTPSPGVGSVSGSYDGLFFLLLLPGTALDLHQCKIQSLANCMVVIFLCCSPGSWVSTHALMLQAALVFSQVRAEPRAQGPHVGSLGSQGRQTSLCPGSRGGCSCPELTRALERKEGSLRGGAPSRPKAWLLNRNFTSDPAGPVPHRHTQPPWASRYRAPRKKITMQAQIIGIILIIGDLPPSLTGP